MSNQAASVRARLLNKAKAEGRDFSLVLLRYGLERLLYRLSISSNQGQFLLKGALLFDLWFDVPHRPTRDIDLLGYGLANAKWVRTAFEELCVIPCDDGVLFDVASLRVDEIRKEANYAGWRVSLVGHLDGALCPVQVDIGFGDAVTPEAEAADYPVMLEGSLVPKLRVYPRYTVIAEKFEAIISLGMANSRLKDYFDLWVLLSAGDLDTQVLREAISATLACRNTALPTSIPAGLSDGFATDPQKVVQWESFARKNHLKVPPLSNVVDLLRRELMAALS